VYIPKNFKAHELVTPEHYALWGSDSFSLFSDHVLKCLDNFRIHYGASITINNHLFGGNYRDSGLRLVDSSVGAKRSKHKKGIAFDLKAKDMDKLRAFIKSHGAMFYIKRVERFKHTPSWCHIEISDTPVSKIYYFKP